MATTALKAHFDGKQIILDEPVRLPVNVPFFVTILPTAPLEPGEDEWLRAASSNEAFEFLADPAEDIYKITDGEPFRDDL